MSGESGGAIEIGLGDVTDEEARVIARWFGTAAVVHPPAEAGSPVELFGMVRGPFCEGVRTLPAEFRFRTIAAQTAEALVTEPCMWTAELPHLYDVRVEARRRDVIVAEYDGKIGLRRLAPRRPVDFAPGTG